MVNILDQKKQDSIIYALAKEYLLSVAGVTEEILKEQITPSLCRRTTMEDIYKRLLELAQNRGMGPKVIGGSIGGIEKLGKLICDFQPRAIIEKYKNDWESILTDIKKELKPTGKIRMKHNSFWPGFCKAIVSSANFMAQFDTPTDFYKWADPFDQDEKRYALPMLLAREIYGLGFALSCDFLKEIGYINFGKPDTHLITIFTSLGLSPSPDDYQVFKSIIRVAKNVDVAPYTVDKLFWIIGSGKFYHYKDKKPFLNIGRQHKKRFIHYTKRRLASNMLKKGC